MDGSAADDHRRFPGALVEHFDCGFAPPSDEPQRALCGRPAAGAYEGFGRGKPVAHRLTPRDITPDGGLAAAGWCGGQPRRRALDLAIAATAGVHGVPLLTYNTKDFQILAGEIDVPAP